MSDTAQAEMPADPNVALQTAANAFKNFDKPEPAASDETEEFTEEEIQADDEEFIDDNVDGELEAGEIDEGEVGEVEAPETDEVTDQPDAAPMPTSWGKEDSVVWTALPPEAQALVAEREGQRDTAVNQKFQEAANIRKNNEQLIGDATANRDRFLQLTQEVEQLVQPVKPNPASYGAGSGNYDRESYDLALAQFEAQTEFVHQVREEATLARNAANDEQSREQKEWMANHQAEYGPRFVAEMPDIADSNKAAPAMRSLVDYALKSGVPEDTFAPDNQQNVTAAELTILAKAMKYDKLVAGKGKPAPKKAGPAIKPGVTSPRSAINKTAFQRKSARLAKSGSIEDGAAIFKDFFK